MIVLRKIRVQASCIKAWRLAKDKLTQVIRDILHSTSAVGRSLSWVALQPNSPKWTLTETKQCLLQEGPERTFIFLHLVIAPAAIMRLNSPELQECD
jgi:hypothetical protein